MVDIEIPEQDPARIGDVVTVSLTPHQLVRMAGLAYLLPLFGMIAGAWLGAGLRSGYPDLLAAAGMGFGLGASFLLMRLLKHRFSGLMIRHT